MAVESPGATLARTEAADSLAATVRSSVRGLTGWAAFALNAFVTRRSPISLVHFVTERCNARCEHCFIDFDSQPREEGALSLDEIRRLTKTLGGHVANVYLTGGEPFLRKDMAGIVEAYAVNAGARSVNIASNGFYTERLGTFLGELQAMHLTAQVFLAFSIDGLEDDHDRNRKVPGLFRKTVESYKMVEAVGVANIHPNIGLTVTPANWDRVGDIYRHLTEDLGVRSVTAIAMRDEGVQSLGPDDRDKIWRGYETLTALIEADSRDADSGYRKSLLGHLLNAKSMVWYPIQRDIYLDPRYVAPCRAGALFGTIMANGDVYPCEILDDRKLGNLRDTGLDFMALWRDRAAAEARAFILDSHCHCSFECAWATNIVSNPRYLPPLVAGAVRSMARKKKHD